MKRDRPRPSRRELLVSASALTAGWLLSRCGEAGGRSNAGSEAVTDGGTASCPLMPEQVDGPFYVDVGLVRGDVREAQPGLPVVLTITVLDSTTCLAVSGAAVEIWSANALGVYSDEASEGTTGQIYLRGVQMTDANGQVTFTTIYPGWYSGRTNHIHLKVHIGGTVDGSQYASLGGHVCHTGQFFCPQDANDAVKMLAPYTANTNAYVTNATDSIYTQQSGAAALLTLSGSVSAGYTAAVTCTVDQAATKE